MTQESGTPPGFWERIQQMIEQGVAKAMRSGPLRNASISGGGLTIKGGFLRLVSKLVGGVDIFYVGPSGGVLGDGNVQQIMTVRRSDGSAALSLHDAFPEVDGTLHQALNWWDAAGNSVLADDTNSGQGVARPWLQMGAYPSVNTTWPSTSSGSFTSMYRAKGPKQQPRLLVEVWGWNDTAGATGEVQVLVNGSAWGAAQATSNAAATGLLFGPLTVPGAHMSTMTVDVQARLVSGAGTVQVGMQRVEGRQS